MAKIKVLNQNITTVKYNNENYISLTDIAKYKNSKDANEIIRNWLRNRNTLEYLGLWERLNNESFKPVEFDGFRKEAGLNSFTMSPTKWINTTSAIGITSKAGRYGGTYAHQDIAFEFASWISVEFKLYLIKEFQRLKETELKQLGWDIKRNLTKINYRIHTDAIKENLIPKELTQIQISFIYASEADILNISLQYPELKGNIRDYADVNQLVCLANLESLNAHFISENIPQEERIKKLNKLAINQMNILINDHSLKKGILDAK